MTPTLEDRADTIARGVWEAMASTQTLTLSSVRDAVFKELAADEVRRASRAEVERNKPVSADDVLEHHKAELIAAIPDWRELSFTELAGRIREINRINRQSKIMTFV